MTLENDGVERRLNNAKERICKFVSPVKNQKIILDFANYCFAEGLSTRRVLKYVSTLLPIAMHLKKDFYDVKRADIQSFVEKIEHSNYAEWTKHDYRVTLKKFFKWFRGTDEYPVEVSWLKTGVSKNRQKLPEELLSPQEVNDMIVAANNSRDKALIALLYESGCRIGEILSLKIKQVQLHAHGYQITVKSQKKPRRLLLIASTPYLSAWLNEHPKRDNEQAYLWLSSDYRNELLSHARITVILKRLAKRAGVRKAVNPYNFRHSRATHLANHLTEAQMKEYFGWVQGSDMASTYVHLSGRDIDNAMLKLNGIPISDEEADKKFFILKPCPRCKSNNPPANKYCSLCGMILDEETARKIVKNELHSEETENIREKLIKDEEFMEMLLKKLGKMEKTKT
ncbi:tyrosine-type recombinase/integrase [Candidatus Latescibacterota bacterium]